MQINKKTVLKKFFDCPKEAANCYLDEFAKRFGSKTIEPMPDEEYKILKRKHYHENKHLYYGIRKERDRVVKAEVMKEYGNKCQCCGEGHIEFLTIDHIFGEGNKHRKQIGGKGGNSFYRWLKKNNYPKDKFRILCFNCNCSSTFGRKCCHQRIVENLTGV